MITGKVASARQAVIEIQLLDQQNRLVSYPAIIDTGFTDYLTLPQSEVQKLGLMFLQTDTFVLGNGEEVELSLYQATILWDGNERTIIVAETGEEILVGMRSLEGYTLFIDAVDGGDVIIHPRP